MHSLGYGRGAPLGGRRAPIESVRLRFVDEQQLQPTSAPAAQDIVALSVRHASPQNFDAHPTFHGASDVMEVSE